MKYIKILSIAFFVCFLMASCKKEETQTTTTTQPTSISYTVKVVKQDVNLNETSVANAQVRIFLSAADRTQNINPFREQSTNSNGQTVFALTEGTYYIRVQCSFGVQIADRTFTVNTASANDTFTY